MATANREAQRFNHEYIRTEHIPLGLVKKGSGVGANVLMNLEVNLGRVRLELEKLVKRGPDVVTTDKWPQTRRAKEVIEYAIEEARGLNHNYGGTAHLPLGLLREREGVAAHVLMNLGLSLEATRREIRTLLGTGDQAARAEALKKLPASGPTPEVTWPNTDQAIRAAIEQLERGKDVAVKDADYELAAALRDVVLRLQTLLEK